MTKVYLAGGVFSVLEWRCLSGETTRREADIKSVDRRKYLNTSIAIWLYMAFIDMLVL